MAASEIEKLERLVRENPKGRLFASLADAYRKDGQHPKALEVLEAGLKNHPDYVSARVVLGRVYMAIGERGKAREAFQRVVELDAESVIALKALADLAEMDGQASEALRWSGQLLVVDPGNDEALKQQERLAASAPPEPRLSGIVPMAMEEIADTVAPVAPSETAVASGSITEPPQADPEATAKPFQAITSVPTPPRTLEIPKVSFPAAAPAFSAAVAPLEQAPEPLPVMPLSEEAQTEQVADQVQTMGSLEPTAFGGSTADTAPTERLAGLDPTGMSPDEVASIGAASGFEPTSGEVDVREASRSSMTGLETISGDLVDEPPAAASDPVLEREQDIELGAGATNEFQESSVAETLQFSGGANEFQDGSDTDLLDASHARSSEAIETGGMDLAFIEQAAPEDLPPAAPRFTPAPMMAEDLEPAVAEPEPVVTESMAELYAGQGHLAEALEVYRQLAARSPDEPRFAERIVELEMFVGGGAPARVSAPVQAMTAMAADASGVTVGAWLTGVFAESLPVAAPMEAPAPVEPVVESPPEPGPTDSLPMIDLDEPPTPVDEAPGPMVSPQGAPTRPASGGFSLSNVFGEGRPSGTAKAGSFDDFFGAPSPTPPAAPTSASPAPSVRSTRPSGSVPPPADDDLGSFQDWLKGLKK